MCPSDVVLKILCLKWKTFKYLMWLNKSGTFLPSSQIIHQHICSPNAQRFMFKEDRTVQTEQLTVYITTTILETVDKVHFQTNN